MSRSSALLLLSSILLVSLTIGSGPEMQAQTPSGLVAAYSFDQGTGTTLTDLSGNNNTGSISGATWTTLGKFGSALSFDGINDWVTVSDAASLDLTTAMTLEAWVFPTALSGWRTTILKEQPGHLTYALYGNTDTAAPSGEIATAAVNRDTRGTAQLPLNAWTHLASTYDGAALRLYVNGTQASSRPVSGSIVTSSGLLRIGGNNVWGEYFQGRIDEVRIFNRALAQAEIQSDMNTPVSNAPKLVITQPAAGSTIVGTTINVAYSTLGDLTGVDHVHFQLDSNPEVMDMTLDGSYQFLSVPLGSHVLKGYLVRADHSKIAGTDASVSFSTTNATDTVAPSVSVTSPASDAIVSGIVKVSADASDNVGVAGVQFLLDGANLGTEDTTAPYSRSWDATSASGSHTISARARDAAGNQTVSTPVTVTVANTSDAAQVGQWSGPFNWPLVAVHAILVPTGEVLMWDHEGGGSTARVWNPTTGSFTSVPNGANLFCAGHSTLPDGRAMVIGGEVSSFVGIPNVNIFDPVTRAWTSGAPMGFSRWYPTATTLSDGRVLALAGTQDCSTCNVEIPEVYDPIANSWTQLTSAPLNLPTYPHMFVLPDGRVLNTGANVAKIVTRVLNVEAQTWTTVDPVAQDGGSAAMYLPGKVIKSGTSSAEFSSSPAFATTYVLDATEPSPSWRQTASMAFPRAHHNLTVLPDGTVLATGGGGTTNQGDGTQGVFEAELWSPVTETWATMARMQVPRLYHSTALLLPDGRVMTAGGESGTRQPSAEIYSPPYLFKGARPTVSSAPTAVQHGATFFVGTPNATDITSVSLVRPGAVTHGINMDQRFLSLTFQQVAGGLNVQAPANAALAPPGSYMLFIVNTAGVPSMGSFLRLTNETEPPVVSITAPASGSTVSGNTIVSADASDNVAVAAVQFLVDNVNLAAADTTAPYSVSWNTATTTNGSHTVTAVARDRAGNQSSSSVNVTVSNESPLPAGLVAAYSFDEGTGTTLGDASGKNNNGTLSGPAWTTGRFGNALLFDGTNDWVTVSDTPSLDLTTGMTLEAWVLPTSLSGWRTAILKEQTGHLVYALYAHTDTNQPSAEVFTTSSSDTRGTASLPVGSWTHVAATYDGAVLRLYVNGTQVATRAVSGSILNSTGPLRIGGNGVWGEYFHGRIDEVRIYNKALSAGEIQNDMNTPVKP